MVHSGVAAPIINVKYSPSITLAAHIFRRSVPFSRTGKPTNIHQWIAANEHPPVAVENYTGQVTKVRIKGRKEVVDPSKPLAPWLLELDLLIDMIETREISKECMKQDICWTRRQ